MRQAFEKAISKLPDSLTKTLTNDKEKEVSENKKFTIDTKIQVYFCYPHSPLQRGNNENTNGFVRNIWP